MKSAQAKLPSSGAQLAIEENARSFSSRKRRRCVVVW